MLRAEFDGIYELAQGKDTLTTLQGDSQNAVQNIRDTAAVYYSRLGFELAQAKNFIGREYLQQVKLGQTIRTAENIAEELYNSKNPVSRRELEYLREGLDKLMNSCASRLKERV